MPIDTGKISGECEKNKIKIFDTGALTDFIEKLGLQREIEETGDDEPPLLNELARCVTALVESYDDIDVCP
jgi:hypothetical protein